LALAAQHKLQSVAFPAISCGAFGYPVEDACRIAIESIGHGLKLHTVLGTVLLVAFEPHIAEAFTRALSKLN
jgi:O-acetyl-ADP-ribose deacetylase (regulator of RNase III)